MNTPIYLNADFYKLSHREQYPKGTSTVYSTLTPRSNKFAPWSDGIVFFGLQYFIKEYLMNRFEKEFFSRPKEEVMTLYSTFVKNTLGREDSGEHLGKLHDLGYLPLEIKALPEGTFVPIKVPVLSIENTHPDFFWLTNFIETIMSTTLWQVMTSATLARKYREVLDKYADITGAPKVAVDYQAHDFSMRGMSSEQTAMASGMGHLTSFKGSDTIPAIFGANYYYNAPMDASTASSIPATEHSVQSCYGPTNEQALLKRLMTEIYPTGIFSVVCDTWDFWKVVSEYLPNVKEHVLKRDGKVVIRPDSSDPETILCGKRIPVVDLAELKNVNTPYNHDIYKELVMSKEVIVQSIGFGDYYKVTLTDNKDVIIEPYELTCEDKGLIESLWDIFGGTYNEKGYKVLDPHVGAIYGDSITLERATSIVKHLEEKGFESTSVVFGVGSYSYQYHTRDTFGWAVKATYAVVDGEERLLFKDPKTDDGTKRSQRGKVRVFEKDGQLTFEDGLYAKDDQLPSLLTTVFKDGKLLVDWTLKDIREKIATN